jgi:hypothetical protein
MRLHACVKPRKLKVSGFPAPRARRFMLAKRPNSMSRVLSGCSGTRTREALAQLGEEADGLLAMLETIRSISTGS